MIGFATYTISNMIIKGIFTHICIYIYIYYIYIYNIYIYIYYINIYISISISISISIHPSIYLSIYLSINLLKQKFMTHRVLNQHNKERSVIHIKWSHEDNPMCPSSSSPELLRVLKQTAQQALGKEHKYINSNRHYFMKHKVLKKHKTRSVIHIKWSHEDNPMHPSSSSPQWLSGNMLAIILTLSSNVFKISGKKNENFQDFKMSPYSAHSNRWNQRIVGNAFYY